MPEFVLGLEYSVGLVSGIVRSGVDRYHLGMVLDMDMAVVSGLD